MGHRIGTERLDDVKMQVFGDPDNPAAAATTIVANDVSNADTRLNGNHCDNDDDDEPTDRDNHRHHQRPSRRGTKRKLEAGPDSDDDEEEEEEEEDSGGPHRAEPMDTGEARFEAGAADGAIAAYALYRDSVFQLCVDKLTEIRHSPDPSLRRSVLICNTLRSIEREMLGEGVVLDPEQVAAACFPALLPDDDFTLDPPPMESRPPPAGLDIVSPVSGPGLVTSGNDERGLLTDLDWCGVGRGAPPAISSDGATADGDVECDGGCRSPPYPQLQSEEESEKVVVAVGPADGRSFSWSSVLNLCSQGGECHEDMWLCDEEDEGGAAGGAEMGDAGATSGGGGGPNSSPSSSSDSGISTASDEIFGDIDLSLYDFDLLPLGLPSGNAAAVAAAVATTTTRPTPAPSAEELLRNCSFASVSQPPPPPPTQQRSNHEEEGDTTTTTTTPRAPSLRRPPVQRRQSSSTQPSDEVQSLPEEQLHFMHILPRTPPSE